MTSESPLESVKINNPETHLIIIDSDISIDIDLIRTFIVLNPSVSRVIFTSTVSIEDDAVENFDVNGISYREYAE